MWESWLTELRNRVKNKIYKGRERTEKHCSLEWSQRTSFVSFWGSEFLSASKEKCLVILCLSGQGYEESNFGCLFMGSSQNVESSAGEWTHLPVSVIRSVGVCPPWLGWACAASLILTESFSLSGRPGSSREGLWLGLNQLVIRLEAR